jgi:CO/xanthine dehydrogenase FAD-binding subunit
LPVLVEAIRHIAHIQIRNKGTIGGSIANADPASELPAMTLALDAELELRNQEGTRLVAAEDFFISYMSTAIASDELLSSVLFRAPPAGTGWAFREVARRSGDFALAGSVALITLDAGRTCTRARLVLFGVAPTPVRAKEAESLLVGRKYSAELAAEAAQRVQTSIDPEKDVHVTAEYRRAVATVLSRRVIDEAFRRATDAE